MTLQYRDREQLQERSAETRAPVAAPVPLVAPAPVPLAPAPVPASPSAFAPDRVRQAQVARPVLSALSLQRQVPGALQTERTALQRQVADLQAQLPAGAEEAALQRAQLAQATPAIPPYYATPPHQRTASQPSFGDVGALYCYETAQVMQTANGSGVLAAPLRAVQRRAVQQFAQAYRGSAVPVPQRAQALGQTLASVQRMPFGEDVASVLSGRAGGLPPADLPLVQRALSEADADLAVQEQQDARLKHLHRLQGQLVGTTLRPTTPG